METRVYNPADCVVFRKTHEAFGGLSNMAAGFPLRVNRIRILTSEALYQACRFPHLPDVQMKIIGERSPMTAKMVGKPFRSDSRPDWESVRVKVMRWCLRVKLAENWDKFGNLLQETGDRPIVEESKRDEFWGAKRDEEGLLRGNNILGRLLMELREQLRLRPENFVTVPPLEIGNFLLCNQPIEAVTSERPIILPEQKSVMMHAACAPQLNENDDITPTASVLHDYPADLRIGETIAAPTEVEQRAQRRGHCQRLIEVDLPIQRISAHARKEKSIRHGHLSTLHLWWARRPLAACRAVLCAALWPDPVDELCPQRFREDASRILMEFARRVVSDKDLANHCSKENWVRWSQIAKSENRLNSDDPAHLNVLRFALLDFIADFSNWDNSTQTDYLKTSRQLTQSAHEALGGAPETRPLVVDPFAGGGSIPLEALRVGADVFASDLNPVAVLLNKVALEYIPKYGTQLGEDVRKWGSWIKEEADKELARFYPRAQLEPDAYHPRIEELRKRNDTKWKLVKVHRETPLAYIWARTISCEGPGCGAEVPLIRSMWLAKKPNRGVALRIIPMPAAKRVDFEIVERKAGKWYGRSQPETPVDVSLDGVVRRGSVTCPCCGYSTPVTSVRRQLKQRRGGTSDARMLAVACTIETEREAIRSNARDIFEDQGRFYRLPTEIDMEAVRAASRELTERQQRHTGPLSLVPDEEICLNEIRRISVPLYGIATWGDFYSPRQAIALTTLARLIEQLTATSKAAAVCLALSLTKQADLGNALTRWKQDAECPVQLLARQAIGMVWDFAETAVLSGSSGSWQSMYERTAYSLDACQTFAGYPGTAERASSTAMPLPDDSVDAIITDPPYYDAVPYAHLSDFFYVWFRRSIGHLHPDLFGSSLTPKEEEIVVDRPHNLSNSKHDVAYYEHELTRAFGEARRVLRHHGIAIIVFASKTTASWEAILQALLDAGWVMTGSWPIDTEMETRVAAQGQARLTSSIHLVCRSRDNKSSDSVGDWRDVLGELPERIHAWMPRLKQEGVVGADAIFACLGPALEIFSRHSRVEKASGEPVSLKEYLPHVWAAVSREALSMVFDGADASGFEEDARITAMWLWTLKTSAVAVSGVSPDEDSDGEEPEESESGQKPKRSGFLLEYDAARKIAQGLGAHLEELGSVVTVHSEQAELLRVADRSAHLFGKEQPVSFEKRKRKDQQLDLPGLEQEPESEDAAWAVKMAQQPGATVLDRLHQSMLLFAMGRGEALRRFLVDQGAGKDSQFWVLAQALAGLYPPGTEELRWVEGLLARKKGLGL